MKIETLSVIAGSTACNARCPFCVSKMTPECGVELKRSRFNLRNFEKVCRLAELSGVTTMMITGKGEPTLDPDQITEYLEAAQRFEFPLIEMQTNGISIAERPEHYAPYLKRWYELGLNTIALSIVHFDPEENRRIYLPYKKEYIDLSKLIETLHGFGFSVRLTCIMTRDRIGSINKVKQLINFARVNKVEQLTLTPVNKPADFSDDNDAERQAWLWTEKNHIDPEDFDGIKHYIERVGAHLLTLPHGAKVFDIGGQNVCLNNCLSVNPDPEKMRNLIFFPDGHVRYYWQHPGAILM